MFCVSSLRILPFRIVLPTFALVLLLPSSQSVAEPVRQASNLGGGFIELLMTGRSPASAPSAPRAGVIQVAPVTRRVVASPPALAQPYAPQPLQPEPTLGQAGQQASVIYTEPSARAFPAPPMRYTGHPDAAPFPAEMAKQFIKQEVPYEGGHAAGTIIIDTPNKFLFLVQANGRALRYGIGVGRPGFEWAGEKTITRKREWPDWRPPPEMLKRRPDLPRYMAGGIENPLGARALYLGSSLYRIHGTNEPQTIGRAVSSGCIRMRNEDVTDLYGRVGVGTKVIVI